MTICPTNAPIAQLGCPRVNVRCQLERRRLRLPDSKTGARVVHLNKLAVSILSRIQPTPDNRHVIVGSLPQQHLVNLQKPWRRIRAQAELEDVRLHDLRHSFASIAAGLGEDLNMIGKLLGHTQAQTTLRYAHLADDPIKRANERIGKAISTVMFPSEFGSRRADLE